jgi:hypothetical protein
MFARLVLFCPLGHKGQHNYKLVSNRLTLWSIGNFEVLMSDLLANRYNISQQHNSKPREVEKTRNLRVFNRVRVGELSKGLQSALPN